MISLLARFGVAINVALFVVWSSWARGGSSPSYLWALPWLCLLTIEMMLLFPPRRFDESSRSAVRHLLIRIVKDPTFYIGLFLLVFLLIQWLNGPRVLEWNEVDNEWQFTDPPMPSMPSCVDQGGARQVFIWFSATWVALLAVRNAMKTRSCYALLRILVVNSAILAALGFVQLASSPDKLFWYRPMSVYFFATFGYPNHAGSFFLLMSAVNMGLLIRALAALDDINHPIFYSITLVLNILAVYFSLCRAAIVLETILLVFGLVYGGIYLFPRIGKAGIAKILAAAVVIFGCLAGVCMNSGSDFAKEVRTITWDNIVNIHGVGDRKLLSNAAVEILKDNPWQGVGGWGFKDHVGLYVPESQWGVLKSRGKANVHNDFLQFLCEHGAIGAGLIFAMAIAVFIHLIFNLAHMKRRFNQDTDRDASWVGSLPPTVVMSLAGLVGVLVHCTVDLPFRSTAILISWFAILACLPQMIRLRD